MSGRTRLIVVLPLLLAGGLALSLSVGRYSGDWMGFLLNFGTELTGAGLTYFLFNQFVERTQEQERERQAEQQRLESEKAELIRQMGSSVKDRAVTAAEELAKRGWLYDGSLQRADLAGANLQRANLQEAKLELANLQEAKL